MELTVEHATVNRWVVKYAPLIAAKVQAKKRLTAVSWRMDETYIKVKGKWIYYYRAVNNRLKLTCYLHLKLPPLYEAKPAGELPSYSEFACWLCLRCGLLFLALFTLSEPI